jgi:hypothetical protein
MGDEPRQQKTVMSKIPNHDNNIEAIMPSLHCHWRRVWIVATAAFSCLKHYSLPASVILHLCVHLTQNQKTCQQLHKPTKEIAHDENYEEGTVDQ